MKKILFSLLAFLPFVSFAQGDFNLKGTIKNFPEQKNIYLLHLDAGQQLLDSAKIINGNFEFHVPLNEPSIAVLVIDHSGHDLQDQNSAKDLYRFFIDAGNAVLTASDSIAKSTVSGLPIFAEHDALLKSTVVPEQKLTDLNKDFTALSTADKSKKEVVESFQNRYEALLGERRNIIANFIKSHPNSYVSLFALNSDLATDGMDTALVEDCLKSLSPKLKQFALANEIADRLSLEKRTGIGATATDFEEKTAEQIPIKLSSFRGQYVLVDFWASWCGPCRQENPNVLRAYETFKDKNFTVLGVSVDQKEDAWTKAVKSDGLVWTQILDRSGKIATDYGISSIPRNFLLDPEGKIIAKNLRGEELMDKLSEVLKNQKAKN